MTTHTLRPEFDFSKLSVEDKLALSKQLEVEAHAQAREEFDSTIAFLADQLEKMGRTKADAVSALIALMGEKERKPFVRLLRHAPIAVRSSNPAASNPVKKRDSDCLDWDGDSRALVGQKYCLPNDPTMTFTRGRVGAINKQFLAAIKEGNKWKDMEVKD